jgi:hypothetical protein
MPLRKQPLRVACKPVCRQDRAGPHTGWQVKERRTWVPRAGHAVEVGREVQGIAVQPGGIPALLVGEEDDDVGLSRFRSRHVSTLFPQRGLRHLGAPA